MIKTDPKDIWNEYKLLTEYLTNENIYNITKKNEKFFRGYQWGEIGGTLAKPTMNKLQHIGKYQVACIVSDDVGFSMNSALGNKGEDDMLKIVSKFIKDAIEQAKIQEQTREAVQYGYIDGACYLLNTFDPSIETGQDAKGMIDSQLLYMNQVYFGNQFSNVIQKQPYIIVALRQYVGQVKQEAEELGVKDVDEIKGDIDYNMDEDKDGKLVTVLLKFFKKKSKVQETRVIFNEITGEEDTLIEEKEIETVWFTKCTSNVTLIPETNLGYTRYPISRFGWEARRSSYLYDSPVTSNIVNQVFINKMYAYAHEYIMKGAIPKTWIDETKIAVEDFEDNSTFGIANVDLAGKIFDSARMPDFSSQLIPTIQQTEAEMKENMGVNDAALGNEEADNAQALMILTENTKVPIIIQQNHYKEMWEDIVRNLLDIMISTYGERRICDDDGNMVSIDFTQLKGLIYKLNVDTGSSSQYSEVTQYTTASNMLKQGLIDLETFVDIVPQKVLGQKEKYREYAQKQKELQQQALMQQQV